MHDSLSLRTMPSATWTPHGDLVMVMAKAAYPHLFADIRLESWMIRFFRDIYRVDEKAASRLIDALWMGWARGQ
jgi:hypothetical protein